MSRRKVPFPRKLQDSLQATVGSPPQGSTVKRGAWSWTRLPACPPGSLFPAIPGDAFWRAFLSRKGRAIRSAQRYCIRSRLVLPHPSGNCGERPRYHRSSVVRNCHLAGRCRDDRGRNRTIIVGPRRHQPPHLVSNRRRWHSTGASLDGSLALFVAAPWRTVTTSRLGNVGFLGADRSVVPSASCRSKNNGGCCIGRNAVFDHLAFRPGALFDVSLLKPLATARRAAICGRVR